MGRSITVLILSGWTRTQGKNEQQQLKKVQKFHVYTRWMFFFKG
jgi:hypothetical protein